MTTTSTTSPTGSTTTTTLLAFEDTRSGDTGDTNTTFFGLDTNAICVAGQVVNYDRLATPFNRSVTFSYESNGTIEKETSQKTVGEFPSTLLVTLTIVNQQSGAAGGPVTEYTGQATADCKLRAELVKAGVRGKLNLSCALGENLSGFSPSLDSSLLQNVQNAFGHGKRARVNTKRGKLTIRHNGDPTDSAPVTCTLNNGG